jgi:hypothetical protein
MANFERKQTIGQLIDRVAVSVGLSATGDAFSNPDPSFVQLRMLANEVGQGLLAECPWQLFERSYRMTTQAGDTGLYPLPDDFAYMIDQTGWQQGVPGAAYPLLGPATNQWWSFLEATRLLNVTIYAWFQVSQGQFQLWPQPPPVGVPIAFDYISRAWVVDGQSPVDAPIYKDNVDTSSDLVLYEPILFVKALKLAFLQARGFDTTKAEDEYQAALDTWSGKDKPAMKLNLNGAMHYGWRPLDSLTNVPETGFGS